MTSILMNYFLILRIFLLLLLINDERTEAEAHAGTKTKPTEAHAGTKTKPTEAHAGTKTKPTEAHAGTKTKPKPGLMAKMGKSARKIMSKPPADNESNEYFKRLEEWAKNVATKSDWADLLKEFHPPEMIAQSKLFQDNMDKNRYGNVHLIDETRVKLTSGKYIHANYVQNGWRDHIIIATQGPTENTIDDFWEMVVDKQIDAIVMVTDTREKRVEKSAQYWPLNKRKPIKIKGEMQINFIDQKKLYGNILETELQIVETKKNNEKHKVTHFHWREWPDHDKPQDLLSPIWLWDTLKEYKNIIVHCSAGIGRTGTIVAIELAQNEMRYDRPLKIWPLVEQLRKQRAGSVQRDVQYKYIYQVLLNYAYYKNGKKIHLDKKSANKIKLLLEKKKMLFFT